MEKNINWFEALFYCSEFGEYDSGINIEEVLPQINKKYFGVYYFKNETN